MSIADRLVGPHLRNLELSFDHLRRVAVDYKKHHDALVVVVRKAIKDLAMVKGGYADADDVMHDLEDALEESEGGS